MPILISLILCFLTHEGGHYLAAICFGERLKFRFAWGRFYVPRYIWNMPQMERWKQRVVAAAGFATEGLVAVILAAFGYWPILVCFTVHFLAYPVYCGNANDFKWLRGK